MLPRKSPRILLVEDDPNCSRLIFDLLSVHGYAVKPENNGTDALKTVQNEKYDLIILDLRLPGENGFVIAEQARKSPCNSDSNIIVLSAFTDRQNKLRAYQAGADTFLSKPVDTRELLYITNTYLRSAMGIQNKVREIQSKINSMSEDHNGRPGHTARVTALCQQLSDHMKLSAEDGESLLTAAEYHDIGLLNPDRPEGHEALSAEMALVLGASEKVIAIIQHHHHLDEAAKKRMDPELTTLIEILQVAEKIEEVYRQSPSVFHDDVEKKLIRQPLVSFVVAELENII